MPGAYSLFNNPFGVSLGYTDSADSFEVWFLSREREPREYVPLAELCSELRQLGYARAAARPCAVCASPARHRCSLCHARRYCSVACQSADWPAHRKECNAGKTR